MRLRVAGAIIGGLLGGALLTIVVELLVGYLIVRAGLLPANADAKPPPLERWIARTSLRASIHREASKGPNPVPASNATLLAGMHSYVTNCAVCHGVADGKATTVAAACINGLRSSPRTASKTIQTASPIGRFITASV